MNAQEILYNEGIALNMCQKFRDEWGTPNTAQLCHMFFRGQDFCIEHDWPKVDTLRALFDPNELAKNGIFVYDGDAQAQVHVAALADSEVHVYVPEYKVCDIYARHNSRVFLHLGAKSFVYISVLDNSTVTVSEKREGAKLHCSFFNGKLTNDNLFDKINYKNHKED